MTRENVDDFGQVTGPGELRLERILPGPIERVWEYLTDSEKRGAWLASGPMDLRVGGHFVLDFHHAKLSPGEVPPEKYKNCNAPQTLPCRITRCDPPRLLSYTWGESRPDESEVTFEMTPQGDQVRLVLTHRRLRDRDEMASVGAGWHTHVAIMIAKIKGTPPPRFWATHTQLEAEYYKRLPTNM